MEREQVKYQFHTITGGVILMETVGGKTHFIPNKDLKDLSYSLYNLGYNHQESLIIMEIWEDMGSHNPMVGLLLHLITEFRIEGASEQTENELHKLVQSSLTLEKASPYNVAYQLHKLYMEFTKYNQLVD